MGRSVEGYLRKQAALFIVLRLDLWRPPADVAGTANSRLAAIRSSAPVDPRGQCKSRATPSATQENDISNGGLD